MEKTDTPKLARIIGRGKKKQSKSRNQHTVTRFVLTSLFLFPCVLFCFVCLLFLNLSFLLCFAGSKEDRKGEEDQNTLVRFSEKSKNRQRKENKGHNYLFRQIDIHTRGPNIVVLNLRWFVLLNLLGGRKERMLVANSFDLWQKDTFFSAAEEVQQSADIMESAYRMWLKARREGLLPKYLDELTGELQMALGTAKWQLEEFEKAVRLSYRNKGDDITVTRHKQFVSAIEDQISRVETALKESFNVEGKKPFRWVNLDEEECDDLALFLSGTPPETSQRIKDENLKLGPVMTSSSYMNNSTREDCSLGSEASSKMQVPNHMKSLEILTSSEDGNCCMVFEDGKISEMGNEISYQGDKMSSNRRTWTSPKRLEIVIDSDDRQPNAVIEATPKEKGSKPFFWRSRDEYYPGSRAVLSRTQLKISSWMNQLRGCQRSQRLHQISPVLPVNSMRFVLALMLTIFLVGMLFLWYLVLLCTS